MIPSSTLPEAEDGHEEVAARLDRLPCARCRACVLAALGCGWGSPPSSWTPRRCRLRRPDCWSPVFSAPLLSPGLLWSGICPFLRSVRRCRRRSRRVQHPGGRLYATTDRLCTTAGRVLLLAPTRARPAARAQRDPIPSRAVRAPRRRGDDAVYVGVDPRPSSAAAAARAAARYPTCRSAKHAAARQRSTLL